MIHNFSKQIISKSQDIKIVTKNKPPLSSLDNQDTIGGKTTYPKPDNVSLKRNIIVANPPAKVINNSIEFYEECELRGKKVGVITDIIRQEVVSAGSCSAKSNSAAYSHRRSSVTLNGSIIASSRIISKCQTARYKYIKGTVSCSRKPILLSNIDCSSLKPHKLKVYTFRDVYKGQRIIMKHLGIDVGTKTIVVAFRNGDNTEYISEINGYYPFERCTPFIKNMLNDPNKTRSDGTQRPARWFELDGKAIVLGRDAEEFAYSKNDTLLRPMAEGGIAADEEAMTVLAAIVQGLISMAEKEIGKFEDTVKLCYCTTAPAINKESNIDYHKRVVNLVIEGYESEANLTHENIKESHAIVIDMSSDGTGIGISWGAGTVTVSYVKYGLEVYSFCWVGAGDWIDTQVAMRHGYDQNALNTMKKKCKETPTTVAKKKSEVDLTPGVDYSNDRLAMDIVLHYDVLINQVIEGIVAGFQQNESEARIDDAISIYMAGGTSSPQGFVERCKAKLEETNPPFKVGEISRAEEPLYSVAAGCLKAAEMF